MITQDLQLQQCNVRDTLSTLMYHEDHII